MLRLPPSQIGLSPVDIKVHLDRLRVRQSARKFPQRRREKAHRGGAYADKYVPGQDYTRARSDCPPSNPTSIPANSIPDELMSEDSVPREDRIFWNRLVAHAGSSSNDHPSLTRWLSHREAAITSSDVSASADSSSKFQDHNNSEDAPRPEPSASDEEYDDSLTGDEGDHCIQMQFSEDCGEHDVSGRHSVVEGRDPSEDMENHHGATAHMELLKSDQADLTSVEKDESDVESHSSNHLELDGSAEERVPCSSRQLSLSSNLSALHIGELERSTFLPGDGVLSDTIYDSSDGDETPMSSSSGSSSNDEVMGVVSQRAMFRRSPGCGTGLTIAAMGNPLSTDRDRLISSSLRSPLDGQSAAGAAPSDMAAHRRRSSNLPRSRLHISHAVVLSSPDKHGSAQASTDGGIAQAASLVGHDSRGRKTYKRRSESNSFVESEMDEAAGTTYYEHDEDSMIDGEQELPSSPPEPIYEGDLDVRYFSREQHSLLARSSPGPHTTADRPRSLPSLATGATPGLHPDALPPPFSASARRVSFDLSLPSSSPASQYFSPLSTPLHTSPNRDEIAASASPPIRPYLPSLPYDASHNAAFHARLAELNHTIAQHSSESSRYSSPVRRTQDRLHSPIRTPEQRPSTSIIPSPSPPPPRTPRSAMRVYDDRLPAYTQPQTPLYFQRQRHRPIDAALTAPAAHARNRYVTPTNRIRRSGTWMPSARMDRRLMGRSDSPVMGSGYLEDEGQENTSVEEEVLRRLETLRRWRQVAERERGRGSEGRLESTPPREERFGWD